MTGRSPAPIPLLADHVDHWFGSKISNALHRAGVDVVNDIQLVIDRLDELPGVGRVVAERIQKLYFCALNGKPLEIEVKEVNTEAWSMDLAPEPVLSMEDFRPTHAPPGSSTKVEILRERASKGQPLWHEEDAGNEAWNDMQAIRPRVNCSHYPDRRLS